MNLEEISKELYLSCLVDRESSKIAFISSTEGGVDIEKVAKESPEKILTSKVDLEEDINEEDIKNIIKIFNLSEEQKKQAKALIKTLYKILSVGLYIIFNIYFNTFITNSNNVF